MGSTVGDIDRCRLVVSTQSTRPVGSIADYDPLNGQWGSQNTNNAAGKISESFFIYSSRVSALEWEL